MHICATERGKLLTSDLKKEVSGAFSKAVLLLAEVCQRLLLPTFPSYLSCARTDTRAPRGEEGVGVGGCEIYEPNGILVILQGQTGGEHRSRSGEGQRRRQGAERVSRKCLFLGMSTFEMSPFPCRPFIMPGRRNWAPMK